MTTNAAESEKQRLKSLKSFHILDTLPEQEFDDLTLLASQICETPMAIVSLVDEDRQWFKSRVGLSATETPRDVAFCNYTIQGDDLFVVEDAQNDARFAENPLVTKDPHLRFYAGAPLIASDGHKLGSLCVLDRQARELTEEQKRALSALSRSAISLLEARREAIDLKNALTENSTYIDDAAPVDEKTGIFSIKKVEDEEASIFQRYIKHYLIALVIIVVTTLIKMLLDSVTQIESPFLLFAGAILLAAWRGGLGPGIFTTLAAVVVIDYCFFTPQDVLFQNDYRGNLLILIFIGQGFFITLLCASRIRGESLLTHARHQLELRVGKRTKELAQANGILHQEIRERSVLQEDLRQARDKALESERRFRDFVNSSLAFFCTHTLDGTILSVSPAAATALGYAESELIGENFSKFLLPAAADFFPQYLKELETKGESRGLMLILTKTGERRIWSYANVVRIGADHQKYVLGSSQDVTELRTKEEELKKSEQRFRAFINNSPTVIFLKDANGHYEVINRSFEELTGTRFEDLNGKTDFDLFPPEIAEAVCANDRRVLETEQSLQVEEIIPAPDGTPQIWISHKFPFKDKAGGKYVGGISVNITERKQMEAELERARDVALESARMKSDFLANMSHEIRTPMNGVIGVTGLLLDTKLDNEQKRYAEIIRNSGESLLTVINDILDFSKVEAGKLELEMIEFNLRNTVESTVELLSSRAQTQQNELAVLIYNDVPLSLCGDAGRIQQILTNLIGNAVKFTKNGDIVVRVKKLEENETHAHLKFSVSDTGEGISKQVQAKLFQPFTQSDASTTRKFGGTGLGLSICRKLVEMMNGEIGVESEPGKGATFWFTLPLEKQSLPITTAEEGYKISANQGALKGKRVLVVDDHPVNREVLTYQMRSWSMETLEAGGGAEAIEIIAQSNADGKPIELVILDLQMPEIDGMETARRITYQEDQKEKMFTPAIILLSSSGVKIDKKKREECGIKLFLTKPYRQIDLLDGIYETLGLNRRAKRRQPKEDIHLTFPPAKPAEPVENSLNANGKPKRILLVEDNPVNQLVAQTMLKKMGYQSDVAGNGLEAIQALELLPYDLVLMDCQMPEMDGYEATRAIRARDWKAAEIPVIALTAHAIEGERDKCLRAGMNDYLSKPVQKEDLSAMLDQWIPKTENESKIENAAPTENASRSKIDSVKEAASPNIPAVDFAVLDDITDNDADVRREVVEIYLSQTVTHLDQIERAITTNDAATLSSVAHKTVGGSAICGMTAIVEPLRKLERLGLDGNTAEAAFYLAQARQAFISINAQCAEFLKQ